MADTIFDKPLKVTYREDAPPTDVDAFATVVRSRRSIRVFDGSAIPDEVMRSSLELATLAPSSSNLQPWEFYWIRDPKKRQQINKAFLSQPAATSAAEIIVVVARTGTWQRNRQLMLEHLKKGDTPPPRAVLSYYEKLVPLSLDMGFLGWKILLRFFGFHGRGLFIPTPREPIGLLGRKLWAVKSASLACQNFMLALRAHGFDSCPMEGFDSWRVRRILKLPCDATVVMGISAGKRKPDAVYGPQIRFEKDLFVFEV